jgi:hypothetical protein
VHRNLKQSIAHPINNHKPNTYRKHNKEELLQVTASTNNIIIVEVNLLRYYYLFLTPWSRVLLEKLTGFQLVKKFPAFYETRKFVTAFTSAHRLSLS